MNHASLKMCKELYQLTGWELTEEGKYLGKWWWSLNGVIQDWAADRYKLTPEQVVAPAYDLGYLLRKMPNGTSITARTMGEPKFFEANVINMPKEVSYKVAGSPEDAICALAIELLNLGVIKAGE